MHTNATSLRSWLVLSLTLLTASLAGPAFAQDAWVRGEVRLNLRSGPGTQYRIIGGLTTGDGVTVTQRTESWTRVDTQDGKEGWIPVGFLEPEPPPTLRLEKLETEVVELRDQLEQTTQTAASLREANQTLTARDAGQRSEIENITLENMELRAGARWPEFIVGAAIFSVGMIVGAMVHRNSRRPTSRIRL